MKSVKEMEDYIAKQILKAQDEFLENANDEIPKLIISQISKGISPVAGEPRFAEYSKSYKQQMKDGQLDAFSKKPRPVNLKLTGILLDSLVTKINKSRGVLHIEFTDPLAEIHTVQGAGKSKTIRKMLPMQEGEEFNRVITQRIKKIFKEAVDKYLK